MPVVIGNSFVISITKMMTENGVVAQLSLHFRIGRVYACACFGSVVVVAIYGAKAHI
jgi:hypothetical protein